jgi:hypothetical protein
MPIVHSPCVSRCRAAASDPRPRLPWTLAAGIAVVALAMMPDRAAAQDDPRPSVRVGRAGAIRVDGRLDDAAWRDADSITTLMQVEPRSNEPAGFRTVVRVVATPDALVVGIRADDPDPAGIVAFTKARDGSLDNEDYLKVVLDTYLDGRSGYVFAVNPNGARYDALVARQGEGENASWDAIWEAAAVRTATGWSAEIAIPAKSLLFKSGLTTWGFNVQRRVQRALELDRWATPLSQFKVTHVNRAGLLTGIPAFDLGAGISIRPSMTVRGGYEAPGTSVSTKGAASLDVTQRLGANTIGSLTLNTDFAETEVDARRTNLTRFSLVFPEKRTFFLEGASTFDFGLGTGDDVRPFFSRTIGLLAGQEVPITGGVKVNGREGSTYFGALAVRTGDVDTLPTATTLGVVRVRQNVLRESSVGAIATFGDPLGRGNAWTGGADATYQTSRFMGDKNLLVGAWGLQASRDGLAGDRSAVGGMIDFPNDRWDISTSFRRVGDGFQPSLGFVPRPGVQALSANVNFRARPDVSFGGLKVDYMLHELQTSYVTGLDGAWQSYRVFMAPVNWRFRSGDRMEFNVVPVGEKLDQPFTIANGVTIPAGAYRWNRFRLEQGFASKRRLSGQLTWWFGDFYSGHLNEVQLTSAWKPSPLITVELTGTINDGTLPQGHFTQLVAGTRLRVNLSPDLQVNSFVQYDREARVLTTNTRLRWTFAPAGELFVVYNHNANERDPISQRTIWAFRQNLLSVKAQYAFRY